MKNKLNETGRSMVEMLGVLGVIGVLSVGGIMGYKFGMMKYRINETINELNILANTFGIQMQQMTEEQTMPTDGELLSEEGAITRMGYGYEVLGFDDHFEITLFDIPTEICEQLQKTGWGMPYDIQVAEVTAETCGEIVYYINNDLSGFAPETDNSDEDDTDEEETPLDCGLYGTLIDNACQCDDGYTGNTCNQCDTSKGYRRMDSNGKCYVDCEKTANCTNEDFCNGNSQVSFVDFKKGHYVCAVCKKGYWGTHCENYDPSGDACNNRSNNPELGNILGWNNGLVANGCACDPGFWGKHCEYEDTSETPLCNGHGTLIYGTCICDDTHTGEFCEIEQAGTCGLVLDPTNWYWGRTGYLVYENGKEVCHCVNGYSGTDCKTPPTESCNSSANKQWYYTEDKPICACNFPYTGSGCNVVCNPSYGTTYGTWTLTQDGAVCTCKAGRVGADCSIPCSGYGIKDLYSENCTCYEGWTGTYCDTPI